MRFTYLASAPHAPDLLRGWWAPALVIALHVIVGAFLFYKAWDWGTYYWQRRKSGGSP